MPRALQISGTAIPLASSASASRSLRMICSGVCRMRFIGSPPALSGENDSHTTWLKFWGAGHHHATKQGVDVHDAEGRSASLPLLLANHHGVALEVPIVDAGAANFA